jgi:hypothetical protein
MIERQISKWKLNTNLNIQSYQNQIEHVHNIVGIWSKGPNINLEYTHYVQYASYYKQDKLATDHSKQKHHRQSCHYG